MKPRYLRDSVLRCCFSNERGTRAPLAARLRKHVAKPIDVTKHVVETRGGAVEFSSITFAVEGLH